MVLPILRSALSAKLSGQKLTVVDSWTLDSHKTKDFRAALTRLDGDTRTILVVEGPGNHNLELASRNLDGVKVVAPSALQAYDVLRHGRVLLSQHAALHLGRTLGSQADHTGATAGEGAAGAVPPAKAPAESPKPRQSKAAASGAKSKPSKTPKSPKAKSKSTPKGKAKKKE